MPNILLKKTYKIKPSGFQVANEKRFSFHGHMTPDLVDAINRRLGIIHLKSGASNLQFKLDEYGHYSAPMNHEYQKHHEEDAVVAILDLMEEQGYNFKFQYDQEIMSVKFAGDSITKREVFIFNRAS
mmetsp:Transcript_12903/g.24232  ORF Transcript_12903/g.24232 Transcript_12903/m.24232 type:complete len:127 (+) Transcript_12903:49-429(+)